MFIGELGQATGVPVRTIRYYERIGLLPEPVRTQAGYRTYDDAAVKRLRFVVAAKTTGLKLDQVRSILDVADSGHTPCDCTRRQITERAAEVRSAIEEMTRVLGELEAVASREAPVAGSNETICGLIEHPST
ncbi:MAG: MerR family transcriptional regulator [Thermocrispum sp.]